MSLSEFRVPSFCPICSGLMRGKSTSTFYDFGACVNCFVQFIEDREERWRGGWRPSPEEVSAYLRTLSGDSGGF